MYFVIVFAVVEISTSLLVATGLELPVARFQVVSMLTGTGYTTTESELISRHPVRRKIGVFLILFGGFSLAVIISSMSAILSGSFRVPQISIVAAVLVILLLAIKTKPVRQRMSTLFTGKLEEPYRLHELPINEVLFVGEDDLLADVHLFEDSPFVGKRASALFSAEDDANLLFICRGEVHIRADRTETVVRAGDQLFVYGDKQTIEAKFSSDMRQMRTNEADEQKVAALD